MRPKFGSRRHRATQVPMVRVLCGPRRDHSSVLMLTALIVLPILSLLLGPVQLRASVPLWTNLTLCALLAVVSNLLLIRALQSSDLSVLGPLNAYKSVISVLLGIFLIGEIPNLPGVAGILLIGASVMVVGATLIIAFGNR